MLKIYKLFMQTDKSFNFKNKKKGIFRKHGCWHESVVGGIKLYKISFSCCLRQSQRLVSKLKIKCTKTKDVCVNFTRGSHLRNSSTVVLGAIFKILLFICLIWLQALALLRHWYRWSKINTETLHTHRIGATNL